MSPPFRHRRVPPSSPRRRGSRWAPLLLVLLATGCGADPGDRIPEGLTLAGRAERILPVIDRLERLERTPIAREAAALRARIAGCDLFLARCPAPPTPSGDAEEDVTAPACRLAESATCVDALPGWAEDLRDGSDWLVSHRAAEGLWVLVRAADESDGSVALHAQVGPVGEEGAVSLLMPAAESPGPARLTDADALVHVRVRPDGGLNLARFVEGGGWAARMYRLKSDLFEGKALAGVWELAVYPPGEGQIIPPVALALDVRDRDLAVSAMEKFLTEFQETWPVRRADLRLGDRRGACLTNARVMPDLEPCYVTTEDALVVGWNPETLVRALAADGPGADTGWALSGSGGRAYFSRFPAADEAIAEATGAPAPISPSAYPWRRLDVTASRTEDVYRFEARLEAP